MIIKMGGSSGGGLNYSKAPKITYSGKWLKWFVEFYNGVPYWEAWFLTSGTLTVEGSYTADAWGIGGGSGCGYNSGIGAEGGKTNMVLGTTLSGSIAVSIGAGGGTEADGGATALSGRLTCMGGQYVYEGNGGQASKRYRFEDLDKADEAGATTTDQYSDKIIGGGWLHHRPKLIETYFTMQNGAGYGGGGASPVCGNSGALVIRIPM